jgi:hypothetical protein
MEKPPLDSKHAPEFFDLFGAPKCDPPKANPRFETPNTDPGNHPDATPEKSYVEEMGEVADDMRQLYTDFGMRPYRVFSVVYDWTGGEVGRGDQVVLSEQEFLPTPLVDLSGSGSKMTAAGRKTDGTAMLKEISPRYTEDDIYGLFPTRLSGSQRFFIEVRMDARDGPNPIRRRYTVRRTPYRDAENFQWVVPLYSQEKDRNREGELNAPKFYPKRLNRDGPPGFGDGDV